MTELRDRIELMQRLNNRPPTVQEIEDEEQALYLKKCGHAGAGLFEITTMLVVGAVLGMTVLACLRSCEREPQPASTVNCKGCHAKVAMANYLEKKGSKQPKLLADALLKTSNPQLLAAVAVVETKGNNVSRGGYKKRHHGTYQINPRHWGPVHKTDLYDQSNQADRILQELTSEYPIKTALAVYGGDTSGKGKYTRSVLAELTQVPRGE